MVKFQMPPNVKDSGDAIMEGKVDKTTTKKEDCIKKERGKALIS